MPLIYQEWITRQDLRANPESIYVFGDNREGEGFGGQAREMRGELNAFGIATKESPSEYLDDSNYCDVGTEWLQDFSLLREYLDQNRTVVWPQAGIGTGLAMLEQKAPRLASLLRHLSLDLGGHPKA
jgi:hypothetical protein